MGPPQYQREVTLNKEEYMKPAKTHADNSAATSGLATSEGATEQKDDTVVKPTSAMSEHTEK
ncbi:AAEL012682-PA [Aedes aegypti]|uniref:AAEL012682-PA n=1 Tax=Aedes aegypti TaxID=7159 RepID=Q16LD0_AEDAE|nr:AAEL012682-PA [Aedes aegypti]